MTLLSDPNPWLVILVCFFALCLLYMHNRTHKQGQAYITSLLNHQAELFNLLTSGTPPRVTERQIDEPLSGSRFGGRTSRDEYEIARMKEELNASRKS